MFSVSEQVLSVIDSAMSFRAVNRPSLRMLIEVTSTLIQLHLQAEQASQSQPKSRSLEQELEHRHEYLQYIQTQEAIWMSNFYLFGTLYGPNQRKAWVREQRRHSYINWTADLCQWSETTLTNLRLYFVSLILVGKSRMLIHSHTTSPVSIYLN